ncbi:MAG: hypothetical protein CM15mP62_08960 [Rhodospirillaceae bacterium]|nr:MAG: hypothetical protein CM15mP62_08960 [Rhodospirillaceae bacterium]
MRILDDAKVMELDKENYRKAQKEYEECSAQIHRMDADLSRRKFSWRVGRTSSCRHSRCIASIGTTAIVMIYLT